MILTNREREIAIDIVNCLVAHGLTKNLAQYGEHGTENWFMDNQFDKMGFWASGGATKACIGHADLDNWIIKVGYTENVAIDYATREYTMYCLAEEAGLAYYFPKTMYLGEFDGRPFYIQERADCNEDDISGEWYERLRDQCEENGEEYDCDELWDVLACLGDHEIVDLTFCDDELMNFLRENRINDLHSANFGYIGDRIVIIDFSGWRG